MTVPGAKPGLAGLIQRAHAWVMRGNRTGYQDLVSQRKQQLFAELSGDVLEIGPGGGANLPFFPKGIRWIAIEPNPYMHPNLQREAARYAIDFDIRQGVAERIDLPDASVDTVVGTLVLCSVQDVDAALREALRVLKPGGRYLFIEHVAAPAGSSLRNLQSWIKPLWRALGDGCHPDRETWEPLQRAGFAEVQIEHFRVPLGPASPHIAGSARKAGPAGDGLQV